MRTCPHCQFLVVDDTAAVCSVCKQPLAVPSQPAGPWGVTAASAVDDGPPSSGAAPAPPGFVPAPVGGGPRGAKVAALVAVGLVAVALVCIAGVAVIGTSVEDRAVPAPDHWQVYRDPAGRFEVELPGTPVEQGQTRQTGVGEVRVDHVEVARGPWDTTAYVVDVPDGAELHVPLAAMSDDLRQALESDPRTSAYVETSSTSGSTPAGPSLDVRFTVEVQGVPCVGMAHFVLVGADPYGVVAIGPADRSERVRAGFDRVVGSLQVPPGA